jgi:sialate O-acetylesterase
MNAFLHRGLAGWVVALAAAVARADVSPAPLFTDGAVLQREKPLPVWGTAEVGEKVSVAFAGQTQRTTTGSDGRWILYLEPLATNAQGAELVIAGKNTITVRNVVVGEVWLCSGQSNMEWPVSRAADAAQEIAAASFPLIRHVRIEHVVAETPADKVATSGWQAATPQTAGAFTAVGYFFARDLWQKLGVPIGIVHASWGGTPIESWLSPAALASKPDYQVVTDRWRKMLADYPAARAAYDGQLAAWTTADAAAKNAPAPKAPPAAKKGAPKSSPAAAANPYAEWQRQNPRPRAPRGPGDPWTPTGLFNGMINPLLPYALRGVLWYQGESNAERAVEYHALFTTMITTWRGHFGQSDPSTGSGQAPPAGPAQVPSISSGQAMPFFWVSLANYDVPSDPSKRAYAFLREAQTKTLALPHTGQALAIDIGDPKDIHPTNKQEVGRRLALLARNRVYDLTCDDTGPTFASATREGATMRVRFTHATGGLLAREKPVQSLELAGPDRVFHAADGKIDRDTLVVSAPKVREPVAIRYAWSNAPEANLYNGAGLPAVPFRSDGW